MRLFSEFSMRLQFLCFPLLFLLYLFVEIVIKPSTVWYFFWIPKLVFFSLFGFWARSVYKGIENAMSLCIDALNSDTISSKVLNGYSSVHLGFSNLLKALQAFLNRAHEKLASVKKNAPQLLGNSKELCDLAGKAKTTLGFQENSIKSVHLSIREMSSTVKGVAENAHSAANSAQEADQQAKAGLAVVQSTVSAITTLAAEVQEAGSAIKKLEEDIQGVGVVLDVIKGIAEQTNLLALNAAIEAARAGEQGRGFAVVADEVRTLASRTQHSTQEIQQIIEQLQDAAKKAVEIIGLGCERAQNSVSKAGEAGVALDAITRVVTIIKHMNTQIAEVTRGQEGLSNKMEADVAQISQFTEATSKALEAINTSTLRLKEFAGSFRIPELYKEA